MKVAAAFLVGVAVGWLTWDSIYAWAEERHLLVAP